MVFGIAHNFDASPVSQHFIALGNAFARVVRALGLHVGLEREEEPLDVGVAEGNHIIHAVDGRDDLRPLVRRCHDALSKLVADGFIKPLVSERLALAAVADGLQRLAEGTTVGRVAYVS